MLKVLKDKCIKAKAILQDRLALKNNAGFTLVEIMVVMVIIAILSGIAVATLGGITANARKKAVLAEAKSVYTSAQVAATEKFSVDGYGSNGTTNIVIERATIEGLLGRTLKTHILVKAESTPATGMGTLSTFEYEDKNANIVVYIGKDGGLYIKGEENQEDSDPTETSSENPT